MWAVRELFFADVVVAVFIFYINCFDTREMFSIGLVFDYRVVKWIINNLLKDLSFIYWILYVTYKLKIRLLCCLSIIYGFVIGSLPGKKEKNLIKTLVILKMKITVKNILVYHPLATLTKNISIFSTTL